MSLEDAIGATERKLKRLKERAALPPAHCELCGQTVLGGLLYHYNASDCAGIRKICEKHKGEN